MGLARASDRAMTAMLCGVMRGMTRNIQMLMMMGWPRHGSSRAGRNRDRASQERRTTFYKSHQINLRVDF
jgi:hypothetical protein